MDYPKSVPGVGLVDGKFVDENPATGQVGSLIPAPWGCAVTDELLNVMAAAGVEPDEANVGQLLQALRTIFAALASPAFTGSPTVPTAAAGNNSKLAANTEFVSRAIGAIPAVDPSKFHVAYADTAGVVEHALNADKVGGIPMRFGENPAASQPYYLYGMEAGKNEISLYNRGNLVLLMAQITGLNDALANKISGTSAIRLNWSGIGGQPTWLFGGNDPANVNLYNPSNFSVNYASNAGNANNANAINGIPVRFAENGAAQPFYLWGTYVGDGRVNEFTLFNRTSLAVGSAVSAGYANQLTGQGLQNGGIGGYILNKDHTTSGMAGSWQLRGFSYDSGTGGDGGIGTRTALWQRVA